MKSHFYLIRTGLKNRFKEMIRKPGKLVLYLLVVLAIAGALAASMFGSSHTEGNLPVSYLLPIFFGFLLLFFAISVQKGLSSGNAIFEMSDVNLLFISPVNPRATLLYGVIRLVGVSFWSGFFLLFQSSTLANFGVGFGGILILFGTFILLMVALTLMSLVIYSVSNGKPFRKRLIRILAILIFIPLLVYFSMRFFAQGDMLLALDDVIRFPILSATPFVGWASAGAVQLIQGNLSAGFVWLGLLVLSSAGMLLYIMRSRSDYYEDVLVATETAFEKKRAALENVQTSGSTNVKVKVTKTGLNGTGVHVFLYKHLRETFRQNRFGFFSMYIVIMSVGLIAASVFMGDNLNTVIILQVIMWIQMFMIGTGRGLLETYSHYIYMIPGSPFKKLLWSNMELMLRTAVESVMFLGIPGVIVGNNPAIILGSMVVYILFSFMILGINYLSMRFTEADISQGILLLIYFIAVLLFIAPGVVTALFVGAAIGGITGTLLALVILSAWELLVGIVCFSLSKNVLHNCDMPAVKAK